MGGGGGRLRKGGVLSGPYEDTCYRVSTQGKNTYARIWEGGLRKRGVFSGAYGTYIVTVLEVACQT